MMSGYFDLSYRDVNRWPYVGKNQTTIDWLTKALRKMGSMENEAAVKLEQNPSFLVNMGRLNPTYGTSRESC